MEDHCHLLGWQAYIVAEWLLMRFSEALTALLALVALNLVLSIKTGLDHLDPAVVARQCEPPCDPQTRAASAVRFLIPAGVDALAGVDLK